THQPQAIKSSTSPPPNSTLQYSNPTSETSFSLRFNSPPTLHRSSDPPFPHPIHHPLPQNPLPPAQNLQRRPRLRRPLLHLLLSYTSSSPFALLDLHNYKSVAVDLDSETAWVDSGATLGEVYHQIGAKSRTHEFSSGVCPTVGVGGFQRKKQRRGLKMDRRLE
ncbi:Berberine bridge enzyme-like 18, partial [Linum grandiflorum]